MTKRITEASVLKKVMLTAGRGVSRVFRNNLGQYQAKDGSWIRYGLCNPGGSDLIGWRQRVITLEDVGKRWAVFMAIEVKAPDGTTTPDQDGFGRMVLDAGGIYGVARSVEDAEKIIANS